MAIVLMPSWILTTDHAASSYGQPVLVDKASGVAYGSGDIVRPYPSWGYTPAAIAVRRMARAAKLDDESRAVVEQFVSSYQG